MTEELKALLEAVEAADAKHVYERTGADFSKLRYSAPQLAAELRKAYERIEELKSENDDPTPLLSAIVQQNGGELVLTVKSMVSYEGTLAREDLQDGSVRLALLTEERP